VDVVFFVTGITIRRRVVLIHRPFVTTIAFGLPVVALERVRGIPIVLKEQSLPVPFRVAALTLLAILTLMLVVFFMAGIAVSRSLVLIEMPCMAGLALGCDMPPP
jgi:hypothetical protein